MPYRGAGPALVDLLAGQVQVMFDDAALPRSSHIKAGKLRALDGDAGGSAPKALPDVPSIGEFVPGYDAGDWYGVGAPAGTPTDIVERLNKEISGPSSRSRP